jgi:hypothetical protein
VKLLRVQDVWLGPDDAWRPWVKQALFSTPVSKGRRALGDIEFAALDEDLPSEARPWKWGDIAWLERDRSAMIVDLGGSCAVRMGLALGQRGWRPVFAINTTSSRREIIEMKPVLRWLRRGAMLRSAFAAGAGAPPAFILDARRVGVRLPVATSYDNRWTLFAGDLPSAERLRAQRIESVTVVQDGVRLRSDLRAIAWAYQRSGLDVRIADLQSETLVSLTGQRQGWLGFVFDQVARRVFSRRRGDGTYGREVPEPSHG